MKHSEYPGIFEVIVRCDVQKKKMSSFFIPCFDYFRIPNCLYIFLDAQLSGRSSQSELSRAAHTHAARTPRRTITHGRDLL